MTPGVRWKWEGYRGSLGTQKGRNRDQVPCLPVQAWGTPPGWLSWPDRDLENFEEGISDEKAHIWVPLPGQPQIGAQGLRSRAQVRD